MAPSDNELPQIGDTIAAKYRIEQVLGRGGMGAVFRVTHSVTGKSFAVKWLLPHLNAGQETAQRFIREAQVAGRVDHPNVVEVYDIGEDRGSMYMVMELLHGESLAQYITRLGRVPYSQACQLLIGVARGLAAAHRSGVIHRDLKPDNIFLSLSQNRAREPRPKILDFGISKISALATDANPALTREGVVMGTPHYMAPEQLRSHKLDDRCDIYALGVILYQMLSGKLPFVGDNFPDLMLKIVSETPLALAKLAPDVPRELVAIVETAMARSAAERFDSAADLGRALEPFGEGASFDVEQPVTVRPPSSILPAATTPVATESRFPPTDAQPISGLQRARRLVIPAAASLVSAGLACWMYVSFDNQKAASHARLGAVGPAADSGMTLQPSAAHRSGKQGSESASKAAASRVPARNRPAGASALPKHPVLHETDDADALPEPHITPLAAAEPGPLGHAGELGQLGLGRPGALGPQAAQEVPSLIGAGDLAQSLRATASEPVAAREPASAEPRIGAVAAPAPMPPPGAAAPPELGIAQPLKAAADVKPRKAAAKKQPAKFESPEIRINDFFQ